MLSLTAALLFPCLLALRSGRSGHFLPFLFVCVAPRIRSVFAGNMFQREVGMHASSTDLCDSSRLRSIGFTSSSAASQARPSYSLILNGFLLGSSVCRFRKRRLFSCHLPVHPRGLYHEHRGHPRCDWKPRLLYSCKHVLNTCFPVSCLAFVLPPIVALIPCFLALHFFRRTCGQGPEQVQVYVQCYFCFLLGWPRGPFLSAPASLHASTAGVGRRTTHLSAHSVVPDCRAQSGPPEEC